MFKVVEIHLVSLFQFSELRLQLTHLLSEMLDLFWRGERPVVIEMGLTELRVRIREFPDELQTNP